LYYSGVTNASEYRVQLLNYPQNAFGNFWDPTYMLNN
jgi:hypothetical protein